MKFCEHWGVDGVDNVANFLREDRRWDLGPLFCRIGVWKPHKWQLELAHKIEPVGGQVLSPQIVVGITRAAALALDVLALRDSSSIAPDAYANLSHKLEEPRLRAHGSLVADVAIDVQRAPKRVRLSDADHSLRWHLAIWNIVTGS